MALTVSVATLWSAGSRGSALSHAATPASAAAAQAAQRKVRTPVSVLMLRLILNTTVRDGGSRVKTVHGRCSLIPTPNPTPRPSPDRDEPCRARRRWHLREWYRRAARIHDCPISRVQRGASDNRVADPAAFVRSAEPGAAIRTIDDHDNTASTPDRENRVVARRPLGQPDQTPRVHSEREACAVAGRARGKPDPPVSVGNPQTQADLPVRSLNGVMARRRRRPPPFGGPASFRRFGCAEPRYEAALAWLSSAARRRP
jgi:hypothetical protein